MRNRKLAKKTAAAGKMAARRPVTRVKRDRCSYVGMESKTRCARHANAGELCSVHARRLAVALRTKYRILVVDQATRHVIKEMGPMVALRAEKTFEQVARKTNPTRFEVLKIKVHKRRAA